MPYAEGQHPETGWPGNLSQEKRPEVPLQAFQLEHNSAAEPGPWEEGYCINTCGILMKLAIPF